MRIKGYPLEVEYKHIDYVNSKTGELCHKTVAKCGVEMCNIPDIIVTEFEDLFASARHSYYSDDFDTWRNICKIYAETTCKDGDEYDPKIGERIARKKIMKRFMSMVRQASDKKATELSRQLNDVTDLASAADKCRDSIIEFLQNQ